MIKRGPHCIMNPFPTSCVIIVFMIAWYMFPTTTYGAAPTSESLRILFAFGNESHHHDDAEDREILQLMHLLNEELLSLPGGHLQEKVILSTEEEPGVLFEIGPRDDVKCQTALLCAQCHDLKNVSWSTQSFHIVGSPDEIKEVITEFQTNIVIVHGDKEFASLVSLMAYTMGVHVVSLNAGLRSGLVHGKRLKDGSGRAISALSSLNFPFTWEAYEQLRHEKIPEKRISMRGNPFSQVLGNIEPDTNRKIAQRSGRILIYVTKWLTETMLTRLFDIVELIIQDHKEMEFLINIPQMHELTHFAFLQTVNQTYSFEVTEASTLSELRQRLDWASTVLTDCSIVIDVCGTFEASLSLIAASIKPKEVATFPELVLGTLIEPAIVAQDMYGIIDMDTNHLKTQYLERSSAKPAPVKKIAETLIAHGRTFLTDTEVTFRNEHMDSLHDTDNELPFGVHRAVAKGALFIILSCSNSTYSQLVHQLHLAEHLDAQFSHVLLYDAFSNEHVTTALPEFPEILYLKSNQWELSAAGILSFSLLTDAETTLFVPHNARVWYPWAKEASKKAIHLGAVIAECGSLLYDSHSGVDICAQQMDRETDWEYIEVDRVYGALAFHTAWAHSYWGQRSHSETKDFGLNFCGNLQLKGNIRCFVQVPKRDGNNTYTVTPLGSDPERAKIIRHLRFRGWLPVGVRNLNRA